MFSGTSAFCQSHYLDSSFDNDGILSCNLPAETKDGKSAKVVIQPDGNIVSAGSYYTDKFFFVNRTLPDGTAGTTFGNHKLFVFPNPAFDYIYIAGPTGEKTCMIKITDNSGKILNTMQVQSASNCKMNISDLKAGVYYVQIFGGDRSDRIKFFKQ